MAEDSSVSRTALVVALAEARTLASSAERGAAGDVASLLGRILEAASETDEVRDALRDVPEGRALLRFTDAPIAIEFQAGNGRLHAEPSEPRGKGPKVDATSATWLGLLGGTLKPWLAFTRGMVVCRAGLSELRWMQTVAERLQRGYDAARQAAQ